VTRVILFNGNFGQHMAILAGFEHCRGERVVTLDADLQNPPEEIAKLIGKMDEGHDYVGSFAACARTPRGGAGHRAR
jgi:undecaprenyl-phosphate 4-deoxy-4-formamido-L-arabinose transferase